jgi:hypothetical protein
MNTVKNHREFACFDYEQEENEIYKLGDIIIDRLGEIGVIIQTFSNDEIRADMNGMDSVCNIRPATKYEINELRPELNSKY